MKILSFRAKPEANVAGYHVDRAFTLLFDEKTGQLLLETLFDKNSESRRMTVSADHLSRILRYDVGNRLLVVEVDLDALSFCIRKLVQQAKAEAEERARRAEETRKERKKEERMTSRMTPLKEVKEVYELDLQGSTVFGRRSVPITLDDYDRRRDPKMKQAWFNAAVSRKTPRH